MFLEMDSDLSDRKRFKMVRHLKNRLTPETMCRSSEEAQMLFPFMKKVFALDFKEKPDYKKLRFLLVQALQENDLELDE